MLFLSSFGQFFSQTQRFIYDTEINSDTINLQPLKHERTFLDLKNGQSTFISENKLLKDSLISVFKKQEESNPKLEKRNKKNKSDSPKLAAGNSLKPSFFNFFIEKNIDDKKVSLVENIGPQQIYYLEDRKIPWKISKETMLINGYKTQKATVNFGGRSWTAWFAPDIKISDGPYKFYGLPGLILKLEDEKGDYLFTFLKKITIPNAYAEQVQPNAKQSTRNNFNGDKAAIEFEMLQSRKDKYSRDSNSEISGRKGRMHGGGMGGGRSGGMEGGGDRMRGGGERNAESEDDEMGSQTPSNNQFSGFEGQRNAFGGRSQNGNSNNNFGNFRSDSDGNPIELR